MKKYAVFFGAAILVMALASPSLAQFKSWGHMEIQTIWEKKPDFNTGGAWDQAAAGRADRDETWKHIAQRFRFYLQYGDVKTVRAVIGFEADSTDWGEAANTSPAGGGRMGVYRADQVQLEVKHAYLDFTIPSTPVMLTAGIQPFDIGGRMWMNNDAPGVILTANFAPHKLRAFWWREQDQVTPNPGGIIEPGKTSRNSYSVNDTYGLAWDMIKPNYNFLAFGAYKNDLFTGNTAGESATFHRYDDHPWWIGVGGGWRPGNWAFNGEFIYAGGKREFSGPGISDVDYKAWAAELAAKYRIGPGMFLGLEGFYSTGQDADKDDEIKLYPIPTGSEGQSIFGNDRTVFFWMNAAQMGYYHQHNLAFMGMWYGRANFEYSPLAWLRFNLNYLYIGDNNEGTPGTGVNAFTKVAGVKQVNAQIGARQDKDEDTVGQEINLITSITIYPGFVYHIGLAAFLPGKVYDTAANNADTAYAINSKLVYAF